ncbi:MAG: hypothetical protein HYX68_12555 [Planctomycetes bacterium]|nr:hypothetical protein [Planctomycetota bacterium]
MSVHAFIKTIDALVSDETLTAETRREALWQSAAKFWAEAFGNETAPDQIEERWRLIIAEEALDKSSNGNLIIDILSWPATGRYPLA